MKPSNIIIDPQGRAVLTDFGLALLVEAGTRGEIFGSPFYIAPEQAISSANATMQSDLYSVGVILYEMITGRVPFIADNPLDVAMLHMTEPPRPPSELNPQVTPQLEAVILKTLAKEPNERYQTGAELVAALDQALRAAPVVAAPIVPPPSAAYALPPIPAAVSTSVAKPVTPPRCACAAQEPQAAGGVVRLALARIDHRWRSHRVEREQSDRSTADRQCAGDFDCLPNRRYNSNSIGGSADSICQIHVAASAAVRRRSLRRSLLRR